MTPSERMQRIEIERVHAMREADTDFDKAVELAIAYNRMRHLAAELLQLREKTK